MPKQIFEINSFSAGIISDPVDERDIPSSAATYSLNIDPLNDGELKGIPEVQVLKETGFSDNFTTVTYTRPSAYIQQDQSSITQMQDDFNPQ
tara:strand:+ start:50 stop:325 length:276 start_codon:yes stop_codon:yes gene_type:complete